MKLLDDGDEEEENVNKKEFKTCKNALFVF